MSGAGREALYFVGTKSSYSTGFLASSKSYIRVWLRAWVADFGSIGSTAISRNGSLVPVFLNS
jgi:hypothetical protein